MDWFTICVPVENIRMLSWCRKCKWEVVRWVPKAFWCIILWYILTTTGLSFIFMSSLPAVGGKRQYVFGYAITGCLTLLEILEIFWKFAKSPGNFLAEFVCLLLLWLTVVVFQNVSVETSASKPGWIGICWMTLWWNDLLVRNDMNASFCGVFITKQFNCTWCLDSLVDEQWC